MTLQSRITKRTAHPIARAERVASRRDRELQNGERSAPTERSAATTARSEPVTAPRFGSLPQGVATLWDVPRPTDACSMRIAAAQPNPARRRRTTVTAVPVDWAAVRSASVS